MLRLSLARPPNLGRWGTPPPCPRCRDLPAALVQGGPQQVAAKAVGRDPLSAPRHGLAPPNPATWQQAGGEGWPKELLHQHAGPLPRLHRAPVPAARVHLLPLEWPAVRLPQQLLDLRGRQPPAAEASPQPQGPPKGPPRLGRRRPASETPPWSSTCGSPSPRRPRPFAPSPGARGAHRSRPHKRHSRSWGRGSPWQRSPGSKTAQRGSKTSRTS